MGFLFVSTDDIQLPGNNPEVKPIEQLRPMCDWCEEVLVMCPRKWGVAGEQGSKQVYAIVIGSS